MTAGSALSRSQVWSLIRQVKGNLASAGEALRKLRESEAWKTETDYPTWAALVAGEFGFSMRQAQYLIEQDRVNATLAAAAGAQRISLPIAQTTKVAKHLDEATARVAAGETVDAVVRDLTAKPGVDLATLGERVAEAVEPHLTPEERHRLAVVGMNALVDEATGYQKVRPSDELRTMLAAETAQANAEPCPARLTDPEDDGRFYRCALPAEHPGNHEPGDHVTEEVAPGPADPEGSIAPDLLEAESGAQTAVGSVGAPDEGYVPAQDSVDMQRLEADEAEDAAGPPQWRPGEVLLTVWWERPSNKLRMEVDARGLTADHWRELGDYCLRRAAEGAAGGIHLGTAPMPAPVVEDTAATQPGDMLEAPQANPEPAPLASPGRHELIDAITDRIEALSVKQRAKWCKVHNVREGNGQIVALLKRCSDVELRTALEQLGAAS